LLPFARAVKSCDGNLHEGAQLIHGRALRHAGADTFGGEPDNAVMELATANNIANKDIPIIWV
jgi:hypothetical protein